MLAELARENGRHVALMLGIYEMCEDNTRGIGAVLERTGLTGGVDGAMVLKRERGRADAFIHVTGRDIEEEIELALRWKADTAGWTIIGDAEEYRLSQART
jgi:hypothetical protein